MADDLIERMRLANGQDDCTCNVADHSDDAREHDQYCAFPLLQEGAHQIERVRAALSFVADLAEEELPHTKVGTGAEVALRHISRRAREVLDK